MMEFGIGKSLYSLSATFPAVNEKLRLHKNLYLWDSEKTKVPIGRVGCFQGSTYSKAKASLPQKNGPLLYPPDGRRSLQCQLRRTFN